MTRMRHEKREERPSLAAGRSNGSRRTGSIVTENGYPVKGLRSFCAAWWAAMAVALAIFQAVA